ncbi:NAD(P)-binding protein [Microthyrium microscopicum]|uniref:NAD(P)-binding protein n=1 Tax=Microthyrium microscopicum TaxID=703497 RepID=A0A6A6UT13_9PEZI|nr:NAD(P)-binding protein [Microthyrium microscopicum]
MAHPRTTRTTGPRVDFSESYDPSVLKGRSALVTGGSLGIGHGCVESLAENGVYVTFADVNAEAGQAAEKELKDKGLNVQFVQTDVSSWEALVAVFKAAVAFSPSNTVDIVIPNAGVGGVSVAHWLSNTPVNSVTNDPLPPPTRCADINYMAVRNTIYAAMYYFRNFPGKEDATHSKQIIFVASMAGYSPMASVIDYNSSKWGVRGMFWALRNVPHILGEGKPLFRVNLIAPTWVKTNLTARFQQLIEGGNSTVKMAEVSDCTDVVLRMASDEKVVGRAAAIAADKKSFDVCDESEGPGAAQVLNDPEYLKFFGYGPAVEVSKKPSEADSAKFLDSAASEKVPNPTVLSVEDSLKAAVPVPNAA